MYNESSMITLKAYYDIISFSLCENNFVSHQVLESAVPMKKDNTTDFAYLYRNLLETRDSINCTVRIVETRKMKIDCVFVIVVRSIRQSKSRQVFPSQWTFVGGTRNKWGKRVLDLKLKITFTITFPNHTNSLAF